MIKQQQNSYKLVKNMVYNLPKMKSNYDLLKLIKFLDLINVLCHMLRTTTITCRCTEDDENEESFALSDDSLNNYVSLLKLYHV